RDRLELLQPGGAAELASARSETARHLRLVPRADLPGLHPHVQQLGELAPQLAQVDALLGGEEEGDLAAVEGALRLHQLDRHVAAAEQVERGAVMLPLAQQVLV